MNAPIATAIYLDSRMEQVAAHVDEILAFHVDEYGVAYATTQLDDGGIADIDLQDIVVLPAPAPTPIAA